MSYAAMTIADLTSECDNLKAKLAAMLSRAEVAEDDADKWKWASERNEAVVDAARDAMGWFEPGYDLEELHKTHPNIVRLRAELARLAPVPKRPRPRFAVTGDANKCSYCGHPINSATCQGSHP